MDAKTIDFLVIGSGFGGSIMSMILRRLGRTVAMVEQGKHPRFAIGESSTPFANLLLEDLAQQYDLPFLRNLSEWGLWQAHSPDLSVGLKRGFTFFHHSSGRQLDFLDRTSQLLVAASPNDRMADTHWYRPEFDHYLVRHAIRLGVTYLDETNIESVAQEGSGWRIAISDRSGSRTISAGFIIDASGAGGVLSKQLSFPTSQLACMPATSGVWAHFADVPRLEEAFRELQTIDTPYSVDDAAVHHVFPGGWVWVLKFNNGITSAGAALTPAAAIPEADPAKMWEHVLQRLPTLAKQFCTARAVTPFNRATQLSFLRPQIAAANWALLPHTAGFVDPLLSTGFALNLLGVRRLAHAVESDSATLNNYAIATRVELESVADLVSALYSKMHSFGEFTLLTLLYFAAMSFSETAWRVNKCQLASEFLLTNDEIFTADRSKICAAARAGSAITSGQIENIVSRFDIAGLTDWTRRNHYPVNLRDLMANAHKLGADTDQLNLLLRKLTE